MVADVRQRDPRRIEHRRRRFDDLCAALLAFPQLVPQPSGQSGSGQEYGLRHRRDHRDGTEDDRHRQPDRGIGELSADLPGQIAAVCNPRDDHRRGDRQEQRRDLRDQRVAHRQGDVALRAFARRQPVAQHPQAEPRQDVDPQDQQRGDRIAFDELARAIHRAVEIGLGGDFLAPRAGLVGGHQPGGEIAVDRHLLARQGVEGEAGRDFGDPARTLGHHHQVDDHQDQEHEQPDDEIAADQERAERLDHVARRRLALVAVDQHDAGRGNVERQAEQGGKQQHRRERREIERLGGVHRGHQDGDRQRDVEHEEHIEQHRGDRHDHQHDERQDSRGQRQRRGAQERGEPAHSPKAFSLA